MQRFESQCQLICMGSCCTNHHVTIQDSPAVVPSTTRMHTSSGTFSPETTRVPFTPPITLCRRGLTTTHQTRLCPCHSLSTQSVCFGSIHPFISFCRHDSSLTCVSVSVTEGLPQRARLSTAPHCVRVTSLCVFVVGFWKCGCKTQLSPRQI